MEIIDSMENPGNFEVPDKIGFQFPTSQILVWKKNETNGETTHSMSWMSIFVSENRWFTCEKMVIR